MPPASGAMIIIRGSKGPAVTAEVFSMPLRRARLPVIEVAVVGFRRECAFH